MLTLFLLFYKERKMVEIRYDFCHPTRQIYAVLPIKGMQLFYLHQSDDRNIFNTLLYNKKKDLIDERNNLIIRLINLIINGIFNRLKIETEFCIST